MSAPNLTHISYSKQIEPKHMAFSTWPKGADLLMDLCRQSKMSDVSCRFFPICLNDSTWEMVTQSLVYE